MSALLLAEKISVDFGGVRALDAMDLYLPEPSVVAIIGPNGAGKTTLFNVVSGILRPTSGRIVFADRDVTSLPPHAITSLGIGRTFQTTRLFRGMTVIENVLVGCHRLFKASPFDLVFVRGKALREEKRAYEIAQERLRYVGIPDSCFEYPVGMLPYVMQRKVEIARALAANPKLLLLDEPTAGLNAEEKADIADLIELFHRDGLAVLIIEHDMRVVMRISRRIVVLNHGRKIADGPPDAVRRSPQVIEAYLGHGIGDVNREQSYVGEVGE